MLACDLSHALVSNFTCDLITCDSPRYIQLSLLMGVKYQESVNQSALQDWCCFLEILLMSLRLCANAPPFFCLLQDFFRDENVTSTLQTVSSSGKWSPVGKRFVSSFV